eukprot:scaffold19583_cov62-Phaeocystis_antarctica.AAC.4
MARLPCYRRGQRRAAGWRGGTGGASRRVRARHRDRCRRRAPQPPPPPPPRCRAHPGAPGGGGCGHGCEAWRGRRTGGNAASLDKACDAERNVEHAGTQEEEAEHGPQSPQGGAWLHGAIAAAAQRGGERAGGKEVQRGTRVAK